MSRAMQGPSGRNWGAPRGPGGRHSWGSAPGGAAGRERGCGRDGRCRPSPRHLPTPRRPPTRRRGGAVAPASAFTRRHPPPQAPVPGGWQGRASRGRVGSAAPNPKQECSAAGAGRAGDPAARGGRVRVGVAEGVGRAFGAAATARTEPPAPFCGQERSPPSPPASLRFPPPPALPRATAPAARRAKLTYLEPDKQEPLRPGSQSPPRVTGPPQPMGAAVTSLYGQSSCAPVSGHLEAPANGHERKAVQPAGPQPPPPPPPWRRGAADWPGPRRVGLGLPAGRAGGRARTRAAGAAAALGTRSPARVGSRSPAVCAAPSGPAARSSSGCPGLAGGSEGGMRPRRTAASQETLGDSPGPAGKWPGRE